MPESDPATDIPPYVITRANQIVDKAIKHKGDVRNLRTHTTGSNEILEETVCPGIWNRFIKDAMAEVDAGNWQEAGTIARENVLRDTIQTIMNQRK